jgi:phosphoheptose isomerase
MIGLLAEEFHNFFDPDGQIDLVSYQHALHKAKEEFSRTAEELKAIRRIVDADPGQSAADAQHLMLSLKSRLPSNDCHFRTPKM